MKRPKNKPEKLGGKKLTLPGLYVKPYESLLQYSDKSAEQKAADYYRDEDMEIPDFEKMDKIERLEVLSEYRAKALEAKANLDAMHQEAATKKQQDQIQSQIKAGIANELAKQQQSASTNA